jgi:hypothetical protein
MWIVLLLKDPHHQRVQIGPINHNILVINKLSIIISVIIYLNAWEMSIKFQLYDLISMDYLVGSL